MLHNLTERLALKWIDSRKIPANDAAIEKDLKEDGEALSDEQRGSVMLILRHVCEELNKGWDYAEVEVRLQVANGITFGTADLLIVRGPIGVLRDWKFGYWKVDAANINCQGWAYGLGAFEKYPQIEMLDVGFLQPRVDDELNKHTFMRSQMSLMVQRIGTIVQRAKQTDDGTLTDAHNLVPSNCKWCSKKLECPPMTEFLAEYVPKAVGLDIITPDSLNSPEDRGLALELIQLASSAFDDMKRLITNMAIDGEEVAGWEIVERQGKKAIRADDRIAAFEVALEALSEGVGPALKEALGEADFNRLAKAISMTFGSLPADVRRALQSAKLVTQEEGSTYLKQDKG
jgi:hypothetical protein